MKVLFCSTGGIGHVQPMRPLAAALQERGHPVAWVTAPDTLEWLSGHGMTLFAAGLAFEPSRREFRQHHSWALAATGEALSAQVFPRLFGATLAPAMLDGVGRAMDEWQPDLVVLEPAAFAAPLACAQRGVPYVTHGYGLPVPQPYLCDAMRWFGPWWMQAGLPVPDDAGLYRHLFIDITPPSLSPHSGVGTVPRLALNPYAAKPSAPSGSPSQIPPKSADSIRAYVTFGTVFNRSPALLHTAVGLAAAGADVIVTVGRDGDPLAFPTLPNLKIATFIDQAVLLPTCDVVVSHGGAGTVLAAAAHGLPQVIVPQGADHFRNGRALEQAAVAVVVEPEAQTAHGIRVAAERVMRSADFRRRGRRLAERIASMPIAPVIARELECRFSMA